MTEQQRQQWTAFISLYLTKMLTQEITDINQVPSLIREAVEEDFNNKDKFLPVYVAQYELGIIDELPILLREQGMQLIESTKNSKVDRYIANVLDGEIEVDEIPEDIKNEVTAEVEKLIGKKLV